MVEALTLSHLRALFLKPRERHWHKGLSGHVVIVGGECGYAGAPRMAAEAALRVGAGLVSVATRPEHAPFMNATLPEVMCHGVTKTNQLDVLFQKATVLIIGPGLGQTDWSYQMWAHAIASDLSKVVDADGLNLLSKHPMQSDRWVLTPHLGEAARLLDQTIAEIEQDRLLVGQTIQEKYRGVCVVKGADSLICDRASAFVCEEGNPGMATAGMGDVLSGVIGGLIAQGLLLVDAAKLGVSIHAAAGDLAASESGERGMIATDLMPFLRRLANV